MAGGAVPERVPRLPRGVRLHDDRVRACRVLLGPERALMLDEVGAAILDEVDGMQSLSVISARLAARYLAPEAEIRADVEAFLSDLAERRLVEWSDA